MSNREIPPVPPPIAGRTHDQTSKQPPVLGERPALEKPPVSQDRSLLERRRGVPAWIMSFGLHAVIFTTLLLTIRQLPRGAQVEGDREAGIVLVQQSETDAQYLTSGDMAAEAGDNADSIRPLSDALPSADSLDSELLGILPSANDASDAGNGLSSGLPGAEGLLKGVSAKGELGGKITTEVFGVQGTGSKFVYLFDRSASMNGFGGRPLKAAKEQLMASLRSLGRTHQFQIIFYNQTPRVFNPSPDLPPRLLYGTEENIEAAIRFVRSISADGSTQHLPALQLACRLQPDVIFFLTDAEEPRLTSEELELVNRWNRRPASINSIEFGAGRGFNRNNFLVRLAKENMGSHAYKDVTQFGGH